MTAAVAMIPLLWWRTSECWPPGNNLTICRGKRGRGSSVVWLDVPTSKTNLSFRGHGRPPDADMEERELFFFFKLGPRWEYLKYLLLWEGNK